MTMKPKRNASAQKVNEGKLDLCQTPPYALAPLLPYLKPHASVWEPAAGQGYLAAALRAAGMTVDASDILTGRDFLQWHPFPWAYDYIITNPPYSIKEQWLAHCYGIQTPFALLVPMETPGRQGVWQLMRDFGAEIMFLSQRVNFKMPQAGWRGGNGKAGSSQFPTIWLCHGILPAPIVYGTIVRQTVEELESINV